MPVNHLLFFLTEVAEPEHGQHEVDIIHIADGQDGEEDNGNQGCRPKLRKDLRAMYPMR